MARRASRRHSHRSGRRRLRPRLRTRLASRGYRIRTGLLVLVGLCLLLALRCLDLIGPPPAVRLDALWVHQHVHLVRIMLTSLAAAAAATGLLIFSKRGRVIAVMLWVLAIAAAIWLFDDRLWIIAGVVVRHA